MSVGHAQLSAATLSLILGATLPLQLVLSVVSFALFAANDFNMNVQSLQHVLAVRYRLQWFANTALFVCAAVWYALRRTERREYGYEMLGLSLVFIGTASVLTTHLPSVTSLVLVVDPTYGPLLDPSLAYGPFAQCRRLQH